MLEKLEKQLKAKGYDPTKVEWGPNNKPVFYFETQDEADRAKAEFDLNGTFPNLINGDWKHDQD